LRARLIFASAVIGGAALLALARADDSRPPGPPEEAITACSSLAEGASCTFALQGTSVSGTCRKGPPGLPAACFPAGGPPHGPPPEAVAACSGMEEGAECAVTLGGDTLDGTCRSGPNGESRACFPIRPPAR